MTDKQNALEVIRFGRPERIPFWLPFKRLTYLGCDHQGYAGGGHHLPVGSTWTDIWGTVWHRELDGVMGFPRSHPLADFPAALKTYRWPDPDDERLVGRIYTEADQARKSGELDDRFVSGAHRETLWEKAYMLVGMETLMYALATEPTAVRDLFRRIMDFDLAIAKHYAAAGVELAWLGDDLGMQSGPLLAPRTVHEFLLPEYRRLFAFYKARGTLIHFHSCGHVMHLLDTFMDLGVDVLNPLQASANDLDELRRRTQGRMAVEGGVDSGVIVTGPVGRIVALTRQRMWQLGRSGGYICRPDQGMPWPKEHYEAMERTVAEFGRYPLVEPSS